MLKVAFFTDTYTPQINGVVSSIQLFRRHLAADVEVFSPDRFFSVRFPPYPEYKVSFPLSFASTCFRTFSIIHVHTPATAGIAGLIAAKRNRIPVVGSYHTLLPAYVHYVTGNGMLQSVLRWCVWNYTKWFYNSCDAVIVPSEETRSVLERQGIRNITVVPTGIEPRGRIPRARRRFGIHANDKVVLHVGRLSKEKNIELVIDAVRQLRDRRIKLIIASDGPYRERLEEHAAGMENVLFTGYLSQDDLEKLYAAADVFVLASETETQGIVLLEAASFALPVVVLDTPVLASFVRAYGTGIVARRSEFGERIRRAVYDKRLRKRLRRNAARAVRLHSMDRMSRKLLGVYTTLLARKNK
ncbi:MAG: glycosyltransferase [Candidatus Aenigmarchaeota archaeon]|nr:glycosyltransferase [Candidatus Aenigmarchaeota archaeon]